jgi:Na+-driven multidrug efflux pump
MRAIIIVMLVLQVAILIVTALTVTTARATGDRRRPVWSGMIFALVIIGAVSWEIGDDHMGQAGADVLMWGSPFLLGMAIMGALLVIRIRRGLDKGA